MSQPRSSSTIVQCGQCFDDVSPTSTPLRENVSNSKDIKNAFSFDRVKRLSSTSTRASFSPSTSAELSLTAFPFFDSRCLSPEVPTSNGLTHNACFHKLPSTPFHDRQLLGKQRDNNSNIDEVLTSTTNTSENPTKRNTSLWRSNTSDPQHFSAKDLGSCHSSCSASYLKNQTDYSHLPTHEDGLHNLGFNVNNSSLQLKRRNLCPTPCSTSSDVHPAVSTRFSQRFKPPHSAPRVSHYFSSTTNTCRYAKRVPPSVQHRGGVTRQQQQQFLDLLLSTVKALYKDELRPTVAEVRRRLQEHRIPAYWLRDLPMHCAALRHQLCFDPSSQNILLVYDPPGFQGFVDPKSPTDPFPCCIWKDFCCYITDLVRHPKHMSQPAELKKEPTNDGLLHYQFQGGRYGMATKMRNDWRLQRFSRLRSLSTARLCHLIQLSIAYGIMQYENNILQPRATCLRIGAAFAQSDLEPERTATNREAIRDTEAVKVSLDALLAEEPRGLLLSQLKFAFEQKLSSRLCQSVFGCTRLSNLLQLPAFTSVCRIIGDAQSRVFVQSTRFPIPPGMYPLSSNKKPALCKSAINAEQNQHEKGPSSTTPDSTSEAGFPAMAHLPLADCCSLDVLTVTFQHWKMSQETPLFGNVLTLNNASWPITDTSSTLTTLPRSWTYNDQGALCYFRRFAGDAVAAAPSSPCDLRYDGCAETLSPTVQNKFSQKTLELVSDLVLPLL